MTGVTLPVLAIQVMVKIIVASCKINVLTTFFEISYGLGTFLKFHMDYFQAESFFFKETYLI